MLAAAQELGRRMTQELEPDAAWVIDDTGFPKQGTRSVGVARQYSGTLGKTGNCQIAVSLHHVGGMGTTVLGWRLYLPESWAADDARRKDAGVPAEVTFKTKPELALALIDQARSWGLADRIVLADAGYGDVTDFRDALQTRQLSYAVGIGPQVGVWPTPPTITRRPYAGKGRPATRCGYGTQRPPSVRDVAFHARGWKTIRWREGTKGWLVSRFLDHYEGRT